MKWSRWNQRDEVWSSANTLLKWRCVRLFLISSLFSVSKHKSVFTEEKEILLILIRQFSTVSHPEQSRRNWAKLVSNKLTMTMVVGNFSGRIPRRIPQSSEKCLVASLMIFDNICWYSFRSKYPTTGKFWVIERATELINSPRSSTECVSVLKIWVEFITSRRPIRVKPSGKKAWVSEKMTMQYVAQYPATN